MVVALDDGIELFSLRFLWWFWRKLQWIEVDKALLRVVAALEVHEE